jgi:hypothetical protein
MGRDCLAVGLEIEPMGLEVEPVGHARI